MIRHKIATAFGAAALAGLGIAATATPANASYAQCDSGALCAYLGDGGAGSPGQVFGDNRDLLQYNKFNNAESVYNNGKSCNVRIYDEPNYRGDSFVLSRGFRIGNLDAFRSGDFADDLASNNWCV
ncbi:peptidase inhibitor family I36 protein [Streptomyces sp. TRM68367]|uniref:peptidase inhibitor family I36 protein n=1 Tax=Streptomyces sp. TRM68367 TaxID=2758415 RepID=UPI00165C561F|nr:peptidase inhibitor family I36 protein [Streptomyces sp. TRM68367]MBC9725782.1 peptidase inhibitor family I36 protein [Streptomyces sp. TRM68367]